MARGEIYLQLSVDFPDDRKVRALARYGKDARPARDLYVQMALYCKRTKSDGHVPDEQIGILVYPDSPAAGKKQAKMLTDVGLVERRDDAWYVLAYLKRNKSSEDIRTALSAKAEAAQRGNHERWHVQRGQTDPGCRFCSNEDRRTDRKHDRTNDPDRIASGSSSESGSESTETETETETETGAATPAESAARATRSRRRAPAPEPPPDGPPGPAEQIVSDWIARLRKPPLERVASAVGITVQAALGQGHDPDDVAEALRRWQAKGNLGPAALASFVHEVANAPRNGAGGHAQRSTTDDRVAQALEAGRRLQAIHDQQKAVGQ